jgi:metal transporter CNNM
MSITRVNHYLAGRPVVLGLAKALGGLVIAQLPLASAAPASFGILGIQDDPAKPPSDPSLWLYLSVALALVLGGGAFAGLTIALMGQVG